MVRIPAGPGKSWKVLEFEKCPGKSWDFRQYLSDEFSFPSSL